MFFHVGQVGNLRRVADRKSTRLNSSHLCMSYAGFCLKKLSSALEKTLRHSGVNFVTGAPGNEVAGLPGCAFFFNDTATTEIYTLSLHDALPISHSTSRHAPALSRAVSNACRSASRSEEHTSELQSLRHLVCRLLLEKTKRR